MFLTFREKELKSLYVLELLLLLFRLYPGEHVERHIKCPSGLTADILGEVPRKKYPAMVITSLTDHEHCESIQEPQTVSRNS